MKKVMAFTMAAVMAASMTACSGSGEPAAETESSRRGEGDRGSWRREGGRRGYYSRSESVKQHACIL